VPQILNSDQLSEIDKKLDTIFTDDYYELLVNSFLGHCGSIKNKDDI
jgi:hypothetical protein